MNESLENNIDMSEEGWTTVSTKTKKKSKLYFQNGIRLNDEQVAQNKETKKQFLLAKQNKKNGKKMQKSNPQSDNLKFQQSSVYSYGDDYNPEENGYRLFKPEDNRLTPEESELVEKAGHKLFCCLCCDDTAKISEIIGRNVYSCGTCYCCIGDDPYGDICTVYVNDETRSLYMKASNKDLENLAKFNDEYAKNSQEFESNDVY